MKAPSPASWKGAAAPPSRPCGKKGRTPRCPRRTCGKRIRAVDKKRARYYLFYTNQAWGKKENYDLCINTSRYASIKACVPGLAGLIGSLFA